MPRIQRVTDFERAAFYCGLATGVILTAFVVAMVFALLHRFGGL